MNLLKFARRSASENDLLVVSFAPPEVTWLWLDTQGPLPMIQAFSRLRLDPSMTDNEKRNAYRSSLEKLKTKKYPRVAVTWSENMTYRQVSIPDMPSEDLLKAFAWELKKKYFYNAEENHFGYNEVMIVDGAEGPEKLFNVFYCDKKATAGTLGFLHDLGLEVKSLSPGQAALAAFAARLEPTSENDVLVCELDDKVARLLVVRKNRNMLVRQVSLGPQETTFSDDTLSKVCDEVKRTIDFYESQKYFRPVTKVLLVADTGDAGHILSFMTQHLGIEVVTPDIAVYLSLALNAEDKEQLSRNPALAAPGLGAYFLREETLNMVPEDIKKKNLQRRHQEWLSLSLIGMAALMSLLVAGTFFSTQWMKGGVMDLEKKVSLLNEKKQEFEKVLAMEKIRRTVYKGTAHSPSLLKDMSFRTPSALALTELEYDKQEATVTLRGEATDGKRDSSKAITQFTASLSESPYFSSATVSSTNQDDEKGLTVFEILCVVKGLQ